MQLNWWLARLKEEKGDLPAIVEEVTIATAEATVRSSNATVSNHAIARAQDIPWVTERMIFRRILKIYPYKLRI